MKRTSETRIFFASDLHGSDRCFKKFLAAASFYGANLLVLGGDLVGKNIVLIRKRNSGRFEAKWNGRMVSLGTLEELREFERECADTGSYSTVLDGSVEVSDFEATAFLENAARSRLESWISRALEKLAASGIQILVIPGNDDPPSIDGALVDNEVVLNIERRLVTLEGGLQVAGVGGSTPTPWHTYREYTDDEIGQALDQTLLNVSAALPLILSVHVPPYGSGLDICPMLDDNLRPILGPGGPLTAPVGSRSVHQAILSHRPILGLFGHIHEGRGCTKIADTICANPGSQYWLGHLLGVVVNIRNGKVTDWLLTEG